LAVIFKPELTTVSQRLRRMGQIAAKTIIDQIEKTAGYEPEITIEPELVQRASSGRVNSSVSLPKMAN
jgi:DNA-binding LacI/PurR family transcriptional regulator